MQSCAIGIRVHSGWGALVAITGNDAGIEVIERRRVEIINPRAPGTAQPFHYAERQEISEARAHVARCADSSKRLALEALRQVISALRGRDYKVAGVAILLSSARPLPAFEKILESHALIHAAEGEFFRQAFRDAAEALELPVTGIRERELQAQLDAVFGKATPGLQQQVAGLGRSLGPPWTTDQKTAALAAAILLAQTARGTGASAV